MFKSIVKAIAGAVAFILLLPLFILYAVRLLAFSTVGQLLGLVPGFAGIILRRVWYKCTLASCGKDLTVDFLGWIRTKRTRVGNHVYIGISSLVGWVDIGDHVMISGQVLALSGSGQHGYKNLDVPMRSQEGEMTSIKIGTDVWVGAGAVLMADVAAHSIVAAGSVVTKTFDEFDIIGGVPAKKLKSRKD